MGTGAPLEPSGDRHRELPRDERVPTRGQSTDGPIVMGLTQCDDGMEHAWSPGRTAAGRRPHPLDRVGAPSCGLRPGARAAGRPGGPCARDSVLGRDGDLDGCQCLNLMTETYGFRRHKADLRTFSTG